MRAPRTTLRRDVRIGLSAVVANVRLTVQLPQKLAGQFVDGGEIRQELRMEGVAKSVAGRGWPGPPTIWPRSPVKGALYDDQLVAPTAIGACSFCTNLLDSETSLHSASETPASVEVPPDIPLASIGYILEHPLDT